MKPIRWRVERSDGQLGPVFEYGQTAFDAYKLAAHKLRVRGASPSFAEVKVRPTLVSLSTKRAGKL